MQPDTFAIWLAAICLLNAVIGCSPAPSPPPPPPPPPVNPGPAVEQPDVFKN